jgi:CBS domain-containing protein
MAESITTYLYETPIEKFISKDVEVVGLDDPIKLVIDKYRSSRYRAVLLKDQQDRLAGIITDNDLTNLLGASPDSPVAQIATSGDIVAIRKDANLGQLLAIMNEPTRPRQIIPVVDDQNHPVGIVSRESLRGDIAEELLQRVVA